MSSVKSSVINFIYRLLGPAGLFILHQHQHRKALQDWTGKKVIFLHIPKAAGTSINKAFGVQDIGHLRFQQLNKLRPEIYSLDKQFAAVIREPMSRLRSTYNYGKTQSEKKGVSTLSWVRNMGSFDEFLEHVIKNRLHERHYFFWPSASFLVGLESCMLIDFDRLDAGLEDIKKNLNIELVLEKHNVSAVHGKREEFNSALMDIVKKIYEEDYGLINALKASPSGVIYDFKLGS